LKKWQKHQKKILIKSSTRTDSKKAVENRTDGGPITRSKTRKMENQKGTKIIYSKAVKNSRQNLNTLSAQKLRLYYSTENGAQILGARSTQNGAHNFGAQMKK
jgi:hypothetical protein